MSIELNQQLKTGLGKLGITNLTAIQKESLEPAFSGKNVIGCSGTGTGKTFAYLLPIIMANHPDGTAVNQLYAVILAPSKELCIQICSQLNQLSNYSKIPITAAALFGGVNKQRQLQSLKSKPNIVVGTYQRIYELIKERKLAAHQVRTLIIDEADKLLNKDHFDGVMDLRKCFMRDIQIMLYSASITQSTKKYAELLSNEGFVNIFTNEKLSIPTNIQHFYFIASKREQIEMTRKVISALDAHHALIFSNSRYDTDEVAQKLEYHHYNVAHLHAKCTSNERRQIMDRFHKNQIDYLICSDIAARGLHFDNIQYVINIGLPEQVNDYLHRAGRCGRNGEKAVCASIITENNLPQIKALQKTFRINFLAKALYQGKIVRK